MEVGQGVKKFKPGDKVVGLINPFVSSFEKNISIQSLLLLKYFLRERKRLKFHMSFDLRKRF